MLQGLCLYAKTLTSISTRRPVPIDSELNGSKEDNPPPAPPPEGDRSTQPFG